MQGNENEATALTPEEGLYAIHETLDRSRSAMYVAGWQPIMLMWGAIVAFGYLSQYAVGSLAPVFAEDYPWYPGPLWGVVGAIGAVASSVIGYRASRRNAVGAVATGAGVRVLLFWLSVISAGFVIPTASGMWTTEPDGRAIAGVAVGIVGLGYVLFGIMHHMAIALVGLGIAAAYYVPTYFAGDAAPLVSAVLILAVVAVAWTWLRRSAMG